MRLDWDLDRRREYERRRDLDLRLDLDWRRDRDLRDRRDRDLERDRLDLERRLDLDLEPFSGRRSSLALPSVVSEVCPAAVAASAASMRSGLLKLAWWV